MFSDEVRIHSRLVGELQNIEMALIKVNIGAGWMTVLLHVVEQSKFHERFLLIGFGSSGEHASIASRLT